MGIPPLAGTQEIKMTIKTRLSVLALVAAAFTTTMITTDSSASDKILRTARLGPVAALKQATLTGNGDVLRKITPPKNLTPTHPFDKGGCIFCHDPMGRSASLTSRALP
jgi:hypothetical protein